LAPDGSVVAELERHEVAQTPGFDLATGVDVNDLSLPVVDLLSSFSLFWPKSALDLAVISGACSGLRTSPVSDGAAEVGALVELGGDVGIGRPGRPMIPGDWRAGMFGLAIVSLSLLRCRVLNVARLQ